MAPELVLLRGRPESNRVLSAPRPPHESSEAAFITFEEFPHEIRCDLAGLRHAANVYGKVELADHLRRLQDEDTRIEYLLTLLDGDLKSPRLGLHQELLLFVDKHSLREPMRALWDNEQHANLTNLLDREDFTVKSSPEMRGRT